MKKTLVALAAAVVGGIFGAQAQVPISCPSSPGLQCPPFVNSVPPQSLTAAQWTNWFASKQSALGYIPVNRAGDTMLGKLTTAASGTGSAGLSLPHGTAPTSPVNGDLWTTSLGLYARVSGSTVGPMAGLNGANIWTNPQFFPNTATGTPGVTIGSNVSAGSLLAYLLLDGPTGTSSGPLIQMNKGGTTRLSIGSGSAVIGGTANDPYIQAGVGNAIVLTTNGSSSTGVVFDSTGKIKMLTGYVAGALQSDASGNFTSTTSLSGSYLQQFGTANAGAVPASGGGTANFLRADGTWNAPPAASAANPTANVGASVVNGSASTYMRSDAAPAIGSNAVTNALLAQMAANTIKGNNTGSPANAADLTVAQILAMLGLTVTGPTTWTPTDASGGGLTFTVTNAEYYQIGKLVSVTFEIAWPATADANSVLIGGLPAAAFTSTNRIQTGALSLNNGVAADAVAAVTPNATTFTIQSIAASRPTNAQMSSATIRGSITYFTN